LFCGNCEQGDGKEKKMMMVIEPIKPLQHSLYKCGPEFHTQLLRDQLSDDVTWGFIIIDGQAVSFHTLTGRDRQTVFKWDGVTLPKKHGRGGQSKQRFERIREQKRGWYVSKVAELATQHFINQSTNVPSIAGLIIGGSADLKMELKKKLDQRIERIVVGTVDVQYSGEAGFNQALTIMDEQLKDLKFIHEKKLVSKFFETISQNGMYCYGVKDTVYALESGSLETFLIWNNFAHIRTKLVAADGTENRFKVIYTMPGEQIDCNNGEWKIESSEPFLDWLLEHYKEFGTTIEFVSDQSSVGNQFVLGFGGIGGFLRYNIELPSANDDLDRDDDDVDQFADASNDGDEYEFTW